MDSLNLFIQDGILVKTKYSINDNWHYNIIHSHYKNNLVINLYQQKDELDSSLGKNVFINLNSSDKEYILEGKVIDISHSHPYTCNVEVTSQRSFLDKRRSARYLTNLGCNLKLNGNDIGIFTILSNLSENGAALSTKYEFPEKSNVAIDIINSDNSFFSVNGNIHWKSCYNGINHYGIIFNSFKSSSREELNKYIINLANIEDAFVNGWKNKSLSSGNDVNKTVLIAEDIKITRLSIRKALESMGIRTLYEASNGNEVISLASVFEPDIITLDISMPGIDGLEALKIIRNSYFNTTIVVISAYIDSETRKELDSLNVKHIISKPFKQEELIRCINTILKEDLQ